MSKTAQVVMFLGSASDMKVLKKCGVHGIFEDVVVSVELVIASAHRNPGEMPSLVRKRIEGGTLVFVCGAGMAAHLAGAVASHGGFIRQVIGVPLTSSASPLEGVDAVWATLEMPSGCPVLTVGIDMFDNAAIAACQAVAIGDPEVLDRLDAYLKAKRALKPVRENVPETEWS